MTSKALEKYCLSKLFSCKEYPFDKKTAVYKVANKMFALSNDTETPLRINVKCSPLYALELRSLYECVIPGYHMNKKHWNTVTFDKDMGDKEIFSLIDDSYDLVFQSLSKKERLRILEQNRS